MKIECQLVVFLGNMQFDIHKNRLLDFQEAESVFQELAKSLAEESFGRYRDSPMKYFRKGENKITEWKDNEICLLQWVVLNFCDQKCSQPSQLVFYTTKSR